MIPDEWSDAMDHVQVAIVGGGPAGAACAHLLGLDGVDVAVIDKAHFPRDKVCAGWITPQIIHTLQLDIDDYLHFPLPPRPDPLLSPSASFNPAASSSFPTWQPFTGFRVGVIGSSHALRVEFSRPVSYGIRRCEFDHYLLLRSQAKLHLGTPVRTIERVRNGWLINGSLLAEWLIGAGGHFCPVARFLKTQCGSTTPSSSPTVMAQEVEYPLPAPEQQNSTVQAECPELYFSADLCGYGWVVRKGNYLNVGIGREEETHLTIHLEQFLAYLRQQGRLNHEIPCSFKGHAYRLNKSGVPAEWPDKILLIGDAYGLAYPQSGEGIRPAVESGVLAAQALLEEGLNSPGKVRESYLSAIKDRLRAHTSASWLPASWRLRIGQMLLRSPLFVRHIVLERWFLHTHEPPLDSSLPGMILPKKGITSA